MKRWEHLVITCPLGQRHSDIEKPFIAIVNRVKYEKKKWRIKKIEL